MIEKYWIWGICNSNCIFRIFLDQQSRSNRSYFYRLLDVIIRFTSGKFVDEIFMFTFWTPVDRPLVT